jgi:Mg-chelatase subunit ChlD
MRKHVTRLHRNSLGGATLLLVPVAAVFAVLVIGVFGFELARASLAREQLRAACDAAALTAAATIANAGELVTPEKVEATHRQALSQALEVFRRNSIAGMTLSPAAMVPNILAAHPKAGAVNLDIDFLDFKGRLVTDLKDPAGRRARVAAKAGLEPAFGKLLSLGPSEIFAFSQAGKQRPLDLVLTVDMSASMCSESYLKVVKRYLHGEGAGLHHEYATVYEGLNPGGSKCPPLPVAPQALAHVGAYQFDPQLRTFDPTGNTQYLAGNFDPDQVKSIPHTLPHYTDIVVDLPGAPFYSQTRVLVEASRGNLDSMEAYNKALLAQSGIPASLVGVATEAEYERQVRDRMTTDHLGRTGVLQPYHSVLSLLDTFCKDMSAKEDCHFALVPFATIAGNATGALDRVKDKIHSEHYINSNWTPNNPPPPSDADLQTHWAHFDVPSVTLDQNNDNLAQVMSVLNGLKPQWGTNTADAFVQANELLFGVSGGRRGKAQPVVLLLTDGLPAPTLGHVARLNPDLASRFHGNKPEVLSDTIAEARSMGQKGARVYAVGFLHNMNPQQVQEGTEALTQIVNAAGRGSKFFLAQDVNELKEALLAIQNDLSQVVLEEEVAFNVVTK